MEVFDYFINVIETMIIMLFLFTWRSSENGNQYLKAVSFCIVDYAFITLANQYSVSIGLYTVIDILICFLFLLSISHQTWQRVLTIAILPDLIISVTNQVYTIILFSILGTSNYYIIIDSYKYVVVLFVNVIHILIFYGAQRMLHQHQLSLSNSDALIAAAILGLCSLTSFCFESVVFELSKELVDMAVGVISVFALCALLFVFLARIGKAKEQALKDAYELQQLKNDRMVSEKIMESRQQLYQLKHDIKHFMKLIDTEGSSMNAEAKKQSELILKNIGESSTPISTPSAPVTYVLNTKRDEAINLKIDFKCAVNLTKQIAMDDSDLYLIFSNLMDNAIKHIGLSKKITVDIREVDDSCLFVIRNSIDGPVSEQMGKGGEDHGYGLETVKRIVDRYEGIFDYSEDGYYFTAKMLVKVENGK